ncbi:MAG: exodeoxyribonuclease VII large subunit [Marinosulfonomonas sp.]|nr:exodeoxyribonuclease VII large subunit [Marinosulfonomonas sp.]
MSDLFEDNAPGQNAPEFTVSEISGAVKKVIEGEFGHVRVRGEIGRVSRPASGHLYFDLKDERAVIAAVSWKGQAARLAVRPEEGMEVIATGRMTTFPGQSRYQLIVENIEPAGAGALMAMLEKRRKALQAEGLFDPELKKPLPYLPEVIGVITSPSGAVIRDILHRLRDRFPRKVLIWPVAVQGQKCAPEVTRAIEGFNALSPGGSMPRPDLLIVARGGGSVEDLWGFNEESVIRAVAASDIPLISAVGHETDTTLIDYVSDKRSPTPTAAAELAVPVRLDLLAWVGEQEGRLARALSQSIGQRGQHLRDLARALPKLTSLTENARQRLDRASEQLPAALRLVTQKRRLHLSEVSAAVRPEALRRVLREAAARFDERRARLVPGLLSRDMMRKQEVLQGTLSRLDLTSRNQLARWGRKLDGLERMRQTLGYRQTLERGYAVVRGDGDVVTTSKAAAKASALEIEFADGRLPVGGSPAKPRAKSKPPTDQGSLF